MVNFLHDFDFSFHTFSSVGLKKFKLLIDFNCDFLIKKLMEANSDHSICSLADSFSNNVIVDVLDC